MPNEWAASFIAFAAASEDVRERAGDSILLASLPGSSAMRSAIATMAVTQQAEDGLRRERQVAQQVVSAVDEAAADPDGFDVGTLRAKPALRAIADDRLVERIRGVVRPVPEEVLDEAVAVAEVLAGAPKRKLTADEAEQYPALMALLSDEQKERFVG